MSKQIEVGKHYKLVDASKDAMLQEVLSEGYITYPADGIVTISSISRHIFTGDLVGYSHTLGLKSSDDSWGAAGIIAIAQAGLDAGAFEEVTDVHH